MSEKKSLRIAYGETLVKLAEEMDELVVLDADLAHATMTKLFADKYPDRFFDMGIAEANMMCVAAGMAHSGLIPFVSTFAIFGAGRAYEQVRNSICYSKANVKLALTHSGICVGEDGGSHQAIEDIALMSVLPGMTVLVPCDAYETEKAIRAAAKIEGPVYIRVARPVVSSITYPDTPFTVGKANVMKEGSDLCIIATGLMVTEALGAAEVLEKKGVSTSVVNMHTIKPLDRACILAMAQKCKAIVTVEEHSVVGGLGSAVASVLAGNFVGGFEMVGVQDKFGKSGTPSSLFKEFGLTPENIVATCEKVLKV